MDILGIGFWEVLVICLVLVIVVGPRRLPEVTRKLGQMAHRFKYLTDDMSKNITEEINREESDNNITKYNDHSICSEDDCKTDDE